MGMRVFWGLLVTIMLLASLFSCEIIPFENADSEEKLNGTWINNRGGVFIFDKNNCEYSEETPIYKGTFTINNNLITQKVTHLYSGNDFINYINIYSLELELYKWYTIAEIKTIIGNDLFNYLASENGLDPITFLIDPIPYSIDGFSLYYGLAIYSKQHSINELNFYKGGGNWNTGSILIIYKYYSGTLKNNSTYIINISGTINKSVEGFGVNFWHEGWELIGQCDGWSDIPEGTFNRILYYTISKDITIQQNKVFLSFISNHKLDDIPDDTLVATINNFTFSIVEK